MHMGEQKCVKYVGFCVLELQSPLIASYQFTLPLFIIFVVDNPVHMYPVTINGYGVDI